MQANTYDGNAPRGSAIAYNVGLAYGQSRRNFATNYRFAFSRCLPSLHAFEFLQIYSLFSTL